MPIGRLPQPGCIGAAAWMHGGCSLDAWGLRSRKSRSKNATRGEANVEPSIAKQRLVLHRSVTPTGVAKYIVMIANAHEIGYSTVPHPASPARRRAKLTRGKLFVHPQTPNEGRGRRVWTGSALKERPPPNCCVGRSSSSLAPSCPKQGRRPPPCSNALTALVEL